ncbi:alpha/beta hydrolase fold protein [Colletotrichum navitas]|uniref:Alpha/beta hydrolase fold protein n=1 Tax=Colletotrichum navitas TaxID=681940 RepID=A0AAD8PQS7_9PEZI|nr:alpha/beta hydrolase fold protein [Colletotrichum navitas]KAK1574054.1 alpha/beta hydrolase fold protein [Colletotrichum navitas]
MGLARNAESGGDSVHQPVASWLKRVVYGTKISSLQQWYFQKAGFEACMSYFYPPTMRPDLIKQYDCRKALPIRIFFPSDYDQTSPQTLPTLFTIHGGGFCIGVPDDDDTWNRTFADLNGVLVIALHYWKAPWTPWPHALHDLEALFLAAVADESLPIDRARVALGGFSAGGNLALCLSQMPSVRGHATAAPKAVVPVYPPTDFATPSASKRDRRPYKVGKLPGIRGSRRDFVLEFADVFDWSYIPYGTDLRNPLVSPLYAAREDLPANVCVVAAELDYLAYEAWELACKLGGRPRPPVGGAVGRPEPAAGAGRAAPELELADERFAWEAADERGSVKWLLVPDVVHAFDMHEMGAAQMDAASARDGNAKAVKVMGAVGEWLRRTAWK